MRWPDLTYCKQIVPKSSWYQPDNKLVTNICTIFFSPKTAPIQKPINLLISMQFKFWVKEIIILYQLYFNQHQNLANTGSLLLQVLWPGEIRISATRNSVFLAKTSGECRTPRNFGLLLTLRGTYPHLILEPVMNQMKQVIQ